MTLELLWGEKTLGKRAGKLPDCEVQTLAGKSCFGGWSQPDCIGWRQSKLHLDKASYVNQFDRYWISPYSQGSFLISLITKRC